MIDRGDEEKWVWISGKRNQMRNQRIVQMLVREVRSSWEVKNWGHRQNNWAFVWKTSEDRWFRMNTQSTW